VRACGPLGIAMSEQERRETIRQKLARMPVEAVRYRDPVLPTGLAALDAALGSGGLSRGRVTELFGPPSCGKTAIALHAVAHAQARGLTAAWIDADRTFDAARAGALGVSLERLVLAQPETAEHALAIARSLALSCVVDLVVIDSAAALVPELELETALGESGPGLQTRVLASGLRRLGTALVRSGAVALVLNQTRGRADAPLTEEFSAGGAPLKFHAAVRISLHPAEGSVRFRILKNKPAAPFAQGELAWDGRGGFANTP
jgi:recombination protein RecA